MKLGKNIERQRAEEDEKTGLSRARSQSVPLLCVKRIVIELRPPQFNSSQTGSWAPPHPNPEHHHPYQPPSLPQLIFHFSSRAYRMRDVSISRQSFPGLCVTCVVISVWLTGSVVSHCPAASDSHRLTLLMMSRKAPRPRVFLQEEKKNEEHKADRKEGMIEDGKKDTSHAFNEKHACTNTYNRRRQKRMLCLIT